MKKLQIIISPAKKMKEEMDQVQSIGKPVFFYEADLLKSHIQGLSYEEAKRLWNCNDKIAALNYERFQRMNIENGRTPALLSYEGIQYQYMAPQVFSEEQWRYVQDHLCILSGFYGILRPLDGVVPYRLEMQAEIHVDGVKGLYDYWGSKLFKVLCREASVVVNLASKEYEKAVLPKAWPQNKFITCVFGEKIGGKIIQKGTLAKMARGEMVRWMAQEQIEDAETLKQFQGLGYRFSEEDSGKGRWVFLKTPGI